jgi:hypothetical protein
LSLLLGLWLRLILLLLRLGLLLRGRLRLRLLLRLGLGRGLRLRLRLWLHLILLLLRLGLLLRGRLRLRLLLRVRLGRGLRLRLRLWLHLILLLLGLGLLLRGRLRLRLLSRLGLGRGLRLRFGRGLLPRGRGIGRAADLKIVKPNRTRNESLRLRAGIERELNILSGTGSRRNAEGDLKIRPARFTPSHQHPSTKWIVGLVHTYNEPFEPALTHKIGLVSPPKHVFSGAEHH